MANRFPLIFNSGAGQIQELAASDNLDLTSSNLVNAGILFTSSGSATAPSLQIGSGTTYNPGLYSPGTDQVAVATNGQGRLFVDANGNIGVAAAASTWSLGNTLEVGGTKPVAVWNPGDGFNALSNLYYNSAYKFKTTGGYGLYYQQNTGSGAHIFATTTATGSADGTATFSETLRITSGGLVGIGTSSPDTKLHVAGAIKATSNLSVGSGGGTSTLTIGDGSISTGAGFINLITSSSFKNWQIASNQYSIGFSIVPSTAAGGTTYTTPAVTIDDSSRVGIGTTIPNTALEVASTSTDVFRINKIGMSGTGVASSMAFQLTQVNAQSATLASITAEFMSNWSGNLIFSTKPSNGIPNNTVTEAARIDASGRLLVGTSSNSGGATCQVVGSVQASNTFRFPSNIKNGGTSKPIAIETISTDGGTNSANTYGNNRYGAGKYVVLAAFNPSGDAVAASNAVGNGSTFVYCITDAATNFPTT